MTFRYLLSAAAIATSLSATVVCAPSAPRQVVNDWDLNALSEDQPLNTYDEARAMLFVAEGLLRADQAAALAEFPKRDGGYRDRDLYVLCFNAQDGKITAHPNRTLMDTDVRALKDYEGVTVGQKIFDEVKQGTFQPVDYKFPKPFTTRPAVPKQALMTKVGNQGCAVTYYK